MASYQDFGNNNDLPEAVPVTSYDSSGGSGADYRYVVSEGFQPTSARSVLRYLEIFFALIMFSVMASVDSYTDLAQAENQVVIGALAFIYYFFMIAADVLRLRDRFPNLDIWEFACDFMLTWATFFSSMALAIKCNKNFHGYSDVATCSIVFGYDPTKAITIGEQSDNADLNKSRASAAFGFMLSFAMVASTAISYKRATRRG